jgi:hypothetical protein
MTNAYTEAAEMGEMVDRLNSMKDAALDHYHTNPKECERILKAILELDKEVEELIGEYDELLNAL